MPQKPQRGRPAKPPKERLSARLSVSVREETMNALVEFARANHRDVADVVRDAVCLHTGAPR